MGIFLLHVVERSFETAGPGVTVGVLLDDVAHGLGLVETEGVGLVEHRESGEI
jgi:hypothetical protein